MLPIIINFQQGRKDILDNADISASPAVSQEAKNVVSYTVNSRDRGPTTTNVTLENLANRMRTGSGKALQDHARTDRPSERVQAWVHDRFTNEFSLVHGGRFTSGIEITSLLKTYPQRVRSLAGLHRSVPPAQ
jgi:hypothetical protein